MAGYTDINTLLPGGSPSTGDSVPATWFQAVRDDFELVAPWGAWTTYTPTVTQSGTVNKTVTRAAWMRIGRLVFVQWALSMTGAGTGNNVITVSLPVAAATTGGAWLPCGQAYINDVSVGEYPSHVGIVGAAQTTARFLRCDADPSGYVGTDPNFALASGDLIAATFSYEANADA